jgi:hypothetical protein
MNTVFTRFASAGAAFALVGSLTFLLARPSQSAGGAVPVQVTGSVSTTGLDNPDLQPFGIRLDVSLPSGYGQQSFSVPTGKRLIIDYVSGFGIVPTGAAVEPIVQTYVNGTECESRLPMIYQGPYFGRDSLTTSCPTKIYADPGSTVTLTGTVNSTGAGSSLTFTVYGHYVNAS